MTSKYLYSNNIDCWYSWLIFLAEQLGIDNIDECNIDSIKKNISNRNEQLWFINISKNAENEGKLRTYFKFKSIFKQELYLNTVRDINTRQQLSRFRTSSHDLEIEKGRYRNVSKDQRLCSFCNKNAVEDELHFLLECCHYNKYREVFIETISKNYKNFGFMSNEQKFIWLLSSEDEFVIDLVSNHISECFKLRKQFVLN